MALLVSKAREGVYVAICSICNTLLQILSQMEPDQLKVMRHLLEKQMFSCTAHCIHQDLRYYRR